MSPPAEAGGNCICAQYDEKYIAEVSASHGVTLTLMLTGMGCAADHVRVELLLGYSRVQNFLTAVKAKRRKANTANGINPKLIRLKTKEDITPSKITS